MSIKEYEEKMDAFAYEIQQAVGSDKFWEIVEDVMRKRQELIFSQIPF